MFKAFLRFDSGGKLIAVSAMLLVIIMVKPFLKNDSGNARLYQDACARAQTVAGMEHNAAEAKLDEIAVEESQKAILENSDPVALQTKLDKEKNIGFILDGNLYTLQKAQEYIDNAKYGTGITHDVPSERYYDNLDAYKRLDTPSLVINEVWDSYYNITGFDLTAVTALLIAALGFLRSFELGTDRCELITANGSKTARLRFWFWFVLTVVLWATGDLTGMNANIVPMLTVVLVLIPPFVDKKAGDILRRIPWASMVWMGLVLGMSTLVENGGGFQWLADKLILNSAFISNMSFTVFLAFWIVLVVFIHIVFAGMNAMVAIFVPIGMAIAEALGFDAYTVGIITTMCVAVGANFFCFNSQSNVLFYAMERFTVKQQFLSAVVINFIACVCLLLTLLLFWPAIGLV